VLYLPHMEPQLPSPSHSPENGPAHFQGGETFSGANKPEKAPEQPEKQETREQHVGGSAGDPAAVIQAAPALPPLPPVAPPQQSTKPVVDDSNPATAADEDLIEKEWVEKAKKVVSDTKHDPYLQGKEVSKLQADYLQKRYGKTVNLPSDGA
jgi:hypothetical protein